jgi:trans-L-3-hydroxyproline dehydratase
MCGHATIALGRFLIDTNDAVTFPNRSSLPYDPVTEMTTLRLHTPCGLIRVQRNQSTQTTTFLCVPSFVSARRVAIDVPPEAQWMALRNNNRRSQVTVDVVFGGAFYAIVDANELGFSDGIKSSYTMETFASAARTLKLLINSKKSLIKHPREPELEFLYGVMIVHRSPHQRKEIGLCFFADSQIDRSPTGSCVSARVALAIEEGRLAIGEWQEFDSVVSKQHEGNAFYGRGVERVDEGLVVEVRGSSYYTGTSTFIAEPHDRMANGFKLKLPQ